MYISKATLLTLTTLLLSLLFLLLRNARLLGFLLCGPRAFFAQFLVLFRDTRFAGFGLGAAPAGTA